MKNDAPEALWYPSSMYVGMYVCNDALATIDRTQKNFVKVYANYGVNFAIHEEDNHQKNCNGDHKVCGGAHI